MPGRKPGRMPARMLARFGLLAWVAALSLACGDGGGAAGSGSTSSSGDGSGSTAAGGTATMTTAGSTTGVGASSGEPASSSGPGADSSSTGAPPRSTFCDEGGWPTADFARGGGDEWGDVAGDFTATTTFGSWTLSDNFSGCDSYVFINDQGSATASGLRNTTTAELFERSAPNAHYFFLTTSGDAMAGAEAWQSTVGGALAGLDAAGQAHWADRVHFVTDMDGSAASFLSARPDQLTFAIDRAQTWDDPGSTSDTTTGAFAPSAPVLGYTARYYNARHAQDLRLAEQQDVTEVVVLDAMAFEPECEGSCAGLPDGPFANSNNWGIWPAEFPTADEMEAFDRMEVVVTAKCGPSPDADCGHWDYEAMLNLCESEACDTGVNELARWITPYARPGTRRWVFEASPLLGLVRQGGTQHIQFGMIWNMNPSVWDIRIRLRSTGGAAAQETVPAFAGNRGFNDDYNTWQSLEFTPPADATRVELVALISGHGQDTGNCAEWCEHQHEFTVNGSDVHVREFTGEVTAQRCGETVDEGVVPGQWGNWTPGRAGWCPGQAVQPWIVDITDEVTLGAPNTLDYRGLFGDAPVTGNRGRIRLSSYVAYSR